MSKITKREAKRLSILKWEWLYDNPSKKEYFDIMDHPQYEKLEKLQYSCGLCEYNDGDCMACFLKDHRCIGRSWYHRYCSAKTPKTRKKYAGLILEKIREW